MRPLSALFTIFITTAAVQAAEFVPLGTLPGDTGSRAFGVSDDGMLVAGESRRGSQWEAFRWTQETGMVGLGFLPDQSKSQPGNRGGDPISGDGSTIVGVSSDEAFAHNKSEGMRGLGAPNTTAYAVSPDGSRVAGALFADISDNYAEAFRWTEENGVVPLGFLTGDTWSEATDISNDSSTVVGISGNENGNNDELEIFKWTEETGMVGTDIIIPNVFRSVAVSGDGSTIASYTYVSSETEFEAFYWTEETGMVGLGWLPRLEGEVGDLSSHVRDMTPDGRLIIGYSRTFGLLRRPFVWTEEAGMEDFQQELIDTHGLGDVLDGWKLEWLMSVSSNGQFFVGHGTNPNGVSEGWLVRLDAPWGTRPIPEPTTALLALFALVPIVLLRHSCSHC